MLLLSGREINTKSTVFESPKSYEQIKLVSVIGEKKQWIKWKNFSQSQMFYYDTGKQNYPSKLWNSLNLEIKPVAVREIKKFLTFPLNIKN